MNLLYLVTRQFLPAVLFLSVSVVYAADDYQFDILDHEFNVKRFKAGARDGEHLVLWVAPGFDNSERIDPLSEKLAEEGIEVWHVDILDNLFIPRSTRAIRELDGRYVAEVIKHAHELTGRKVTLMSRAYGALPALQGARQWQLKHDKNNDAYLTGAILFSPELYGEIPPLGLDPIYHPISTATNVPIMFYQAGKRGNRWQLDKSMEKLEQGGAAIRLKMLPGVTGVFYHEDMAEATLALLEKLPEELPRVINMLDKVPTPVEAAAMDIPEIKPYGLDHSLKLFRGNIKPIPINLKSSEGHKVIRESFKGKVTVVNFWASWCPPCVEEIPSLNRLRATMQGEAFELISINYAETPEQVAEFMSMVDVDYPVLLDEDGRYTAQWNVLVYPATFIISPKGKIVYGVNGAIEWDSEEVISEVKALLRN